MLCHNGRILLYCNSHEKCFLFVISHTYFFLDERPAWCNLTPDASGFHLLIHTLFCKCVRSQKECERFLRGRMSRVARSDQISGFWGYKLSQDKCLSDLYFWSWMNLILILTPGLLVISFFESCTSIVFPVFYYLILLIILFPLRFYFGVRVDNNCTEERAHREHVWGNNLDHLKLRTINQ